MTPDKKQRKEAAFKISSSNFFRGCMVQNIAARVVDYNGIKAINQLNSIKLRQSKI